MRLCIMRAGDLLPFSSDVRPMRSDLIAMEASHRGWDVTIVRPSFCHHTKRFMEEKLDFSPEAYKTRYLECGGYQGHMSFRRVLFHFRYGAECFRFLLNSGLESQSKYDACVFVSTPLEACFMAMVACKFKKITFVLDLQDVWPDAIIKRLSIFKRIIFSPFLAFQKLLQIATFRYSDSVISVSAGFLSRTARLREAKRKNDDVFFLGYPVPEKQITLGKKAGGNHDSFEKPRFTFTYVGTLSHNYVLETVLAAAKILSKRQVDCEFIIIGDGPDGKRLREISDDIQIVSFLGWQDFSQISEVFRRTSVGLIPCDSDIDTMPNKLFEYVCNRIPVLSSLEGEAQRFIEENNVGFSYGAYDVESLVRLCLRLEGDRELVYNLKRNCEAIADSLSAPKVYKRLVEHLSRLRQK